MTPLPNTLSWHDAPFRKSTGTTLPFYLLPLQWFHSPVRFHGAVLT